MMINHDGLLNVMLRLHEKLIFAAYSLSVAYSHIIISWPLNLCPSSCFSMKTRRRWLTNAFEPCRLIKKSTTTRLKKFWPKESTIPFQPRLNPIHKAFLIWVMHIVYRVFKQVQTAPPSYLGLDFSHQSTRTLEWPFDRKAKS